MPHDAPAESDDGRWPAEGFVHNLTDEHYYVRSFGAPKECLPDSVFSSAADPHQSALDASDYLVYPNAPREVSVTLRVHY